MAHFARVEVTQKPGQAVVREVIAINNAAINDEQFPTSETIGQSLISQIGLTGQWLQTSYNANFRGKFAGIGDMWDGQKFSAPKEEVQD